MSNNAAMPEDAMGQRRMMLRRLLGSHQWERAAEVARDSLSSDPEDMEAHLAAGQSLVNLGKYQAAEVHVDKVLAKRPDHVFALRLASITCFHLQKRAAADEHIRRAIELQPNDAHNWYHLALMRYRQGSLDVAEKHANRALELQPRDANTINLLALCHRGNPEGQLEQYLRALEIDPENPSVHTNLGAYYINHARDPAAAEASFRRALSYNPNDPLAQKNLFGVLRMRDPIYRVLTFPRTMFFAASWRRRGQSTLARIALVFLWIGMGRYFIALFAVWLLLIWPLVKAYEFLTVSDIRARAGVVGAKRGWRRWPLPARLGLFALLIACFWGGLFWLYWKELLAPETIIFMGIAALLAWYIPLLFRWVKRSRHRAAALRAEKRFQRQTATPDPY